MKYRMCYGALSALVGLVGITCSNLTVAGIGVVFMFYFWVLAP
jgi:hypothetical protein